MTRRFEPVCRNAAGPLSALHQACFPEDPWDLQAITEMMGIPGFFGLVAWDEEVPAGFALALDLGKECEVLSLGVVLDRRRAGLGLSLLDAVCCEARRRGAECVALEVSVDNRAARALYAATGFTVVGRRPNYYRQGGRSVDALTLRLALATPLPAT
jgi:ribosomal-protein-alanine N-acetyltransferase